MSNKSKKTQPKPQSSISFSLGRWFKHLTTNAPTTTVVTVIVIVYAIFLFGGGLFDLTNWQTIQPSGYYNNQFLFLAPGLSNQYISDTLITGILYSMGFIGLLAIYQSTKNAYKPRQAYMLLIIGITFLLIAYVFLEGSISFKTNFG